VSATIFWRQRIGPTCRSDLSPRNLCRCEQRFRWLLLFLSFSVISPPQSFVDITSRAGTVDDTIACIEPILLHLPLSL